MAFRIRAVWLLAMLCEGIGLLEGAAAEQVQYNQTNLQDSVLAGKALFSGTTRFRNKGPACGACHTIAGIGFPNGGSLGPDLTAASSKLGPVGLEATLQTLYFPTMTPLFRARPLTAEERQDLSALFAEAQYAAPPRDNTAVLFGIGVAGCIGLLGLTWVAGRRRPEPMRQSLVQRSILTPEMNP